MKAGEGPSPTPKSEHRAAPGAPARCPKKNGVRGEFLPPDLPSHATPFIVASNPLNSSTAFASKNGMICVRNTPAVPRPWSIQ